MHRVFIDGGEGTTGLRIHERLSKQDGIALLTLDGEKRKDPAARKELLHTADVAFLCLPDDAARESVALSDGSRVRIIDASAAHRTANGWRYGFPELSEAHRAGVIFGSRVAVPGCHASGFIALVSPLVSAGILSPEAPLACFSLTGYSGGGKKMIAEYEDSWRDAAFDAPRTYATLQSHKHLPEMQKYAGTAFPPVFSPVVADFYAGMLVNVPLHQNMLEKRLRPQDIREIYAQHYEGSKLIKVLPYTAENQTLAANALAGKDTMELAVAGNGERMTLLARYDNLGKGASGAAIQCMNLMLGREETEGLSV
ncbi:MAG TPA: N-acetyl-gamma-glutamyl-phosphate reductase [Feifaniaceae bacterium]|nr:N-acetyl-gamma-glutamyl-phosphate reductase [Feifaniaceae bacterium]